MLQMDMYVRKLRQPAWARSGLIALGLMLGTQLFCLSARAQIFFGPPNDDLTNSWVLFGDAGTTNGSSFNATAEPLEPNHWFNNASNSVWFRWIPTNSGFATFDTFGSSFDTVLAVYNRSVLLTNLAPTFPTLFQVVANDDFNPPGSLPTNLASSVTFSVSPFAEYFVALVGYDENRFLGEIDEGPYILNWNVSSTFTNITASTNQIQFLLADYTVREDTPGFATITVVYNQTNAPGPVRVDYATQDGTAVQGVDYLNTRGTLEFARGQTRKTFSVPIMDNPFVNSNKTVHLMLSNPTGGAGLGPRFAALLTITDDETIPPSNIAGQFQFSRPAYQVTENERSSSSSRWNTLGYPGSNYREIPGALITVTRTNGARGRVMVDYYTTNKLDPENYGGIVVLADEIADYTPVSGTLVFDDYQMSTNFIVPIWSGSSFTMLTNRTLTKLVPLVLANPRAALGEDAAAIVPTLEPTNQAVVEIVYVNNAIGGFSIEKAHYRMNEYGPGRIRLDVILPSFDPQLSPRPASVQVSTWNGYGLLRPDEGSDYADFARFQFPNTLATDGSPILINPQDFQPINSVTLNYGQFDSVRSIDVVCLDDTTVEFNEDIQVWLHDPDVNHHLGPNPTANVTILYDEPPPGAADREWNPSGVPYSNPPFNTVPGANNTVYAVAVQADQKSIIGGDFIAYNAEPRNRVARIFANGFLDPTFNPGTGADGTVAAIALYTANVTNTIAASRDSIYIGGSFSSYNGIQRNGIARLLSNGALDTSFNPGLGVDGSVLDIAIQLDGKIVIAGDFTTYNRQPRNRIARLNEDGSLDTTFNPGDGANGTIWSVAVRDFPYPILVPRVAEGTEFQDINDIETGANQGTLTVDYDFLVVPDTIRVYYDNVLLLNQTLNGTGRLVVPYGPGNSTQIRIVMNEGQGIPGTLWFYTANITPVIPSRTLYIGGEFINYDGEFRFGVARLNDDGSLDTTFNPGAGANNSVYAVAVQQDGKLLVGGVFSEVDFVALNSIARLNRDGTVDTTFLPGHGFDDAVYHIAMQPDMKPLIGGIFTSFNQARRMGLARLFTSGALDTGFMDTAFNQFAGLISTYYFESPHFVNSIALETNGNIMIGGSFTNLGGHAPIAVNNAGGPYPHWTRADKVPRYNVARLIGTWGVETSTVTVIATNNGVVTTNTFDVATPNAPQGPGNLEFLTAEYSTDENSDFTRVRLQRIDGRLGTAVGELASSSRLAIAGQDFQNVSTNSIWDEWAYVAPIHVGYVGLNYLDITILDDEEIEGDHSFGLEFLRPYGSIDLGGEFVPLGTSLGRRNAQVRIVDNDFRHGTFAFSQPIFTVNENGVNALITVVRINGDNGPVSVDYYTDDASPFTTATVGQDYQSKRKTLSFNSGETNKTFTISILNDTLVEFDENIRLVLTNATGGASLTNVEPGTLTLQQQSAATQTASLIVVDDDFKPGRLNFSQPVYQTNETAGWARIVVTRTGGNQTELRVWAVASPGTAVPGANFVPVSSLLIWGHQDSSPKTIDVQLIHDFQVRGPLSVQLQLMSAMVAGTNNPVALGNQAVATLIIEDVDAHGALAFGSSAFATDENGTSATITVVRRDGIAGPVTVDYTTGDDSAANGYDYVTAAGTLTFANGEISKAFSVTVLDNAQMDGDRDLNLVLSNPTGGAVLIDPSAARLTIVDNESAAIPAGTLDSTFNENGAIGANEPIYALALEPDGKMLMAGDFTRVNQIPRARIARLTPEANLDPAFNAGGGPNGPIRALALQPDGRILIGGFFTTFSGTNRNHFARLNPDGTVDAAFNPGAGADNPVLAIALKPDGQMVIGGSFATYNSHSQPYLARVNPNGSLDRSFAVGAGPNGIVYAVAVQSDGKVLCGGEFTLVNNTNRHRIARLNTDGSLDPTFNPGSGFNGTVRAILVQGDGRILVGGSFTNFNGIDRNFLARLDADGTLDESYLLEQSGGNDTVFALASQADGKLIVGGNFTRFNGVTRNRITRLNPDGTTDPAINFGAGANGFVAALLIQPDRKIVLGGGFTEVQGRSRNRIARVHGGSIAGAGALEFSQATYNVSETDGFAQVWVQRRGGTFGEVSVRVATADGTARAGADYAPVLTALTFPTGEYFQSLIIPVVDDTLVEEPETVNLQLSDPAGATLGAQPNAMLVIASDDSLIGFANESFSVNENVQSGFAAFPVLRTGATNSAVSVTFLTVAGGTATAGIDYSNVPPLNLDFAPGQTAKTVFVPILTDALVEGDETIWLALTNAFPTNIASLSLSNAVLTIVDDDFAPGIIAFSTTNFVVTENATNAVITVIRRNGASGFASVSYATGDGTARAGLDYLASSGILAFGDEETAKTFLVPILNNTSTNADRTIYLRLFNAAGGATLAETNAVLTIVDDEIGASYFGFSTTNFVVDEFDAFAVVTVTRTNSRRGVVTVDYRTANGTALAGQDYTAVSGTLMLGDGEAFKVFTIPLVNDTLGEPNEFLNLILFNPQPANGAFLSMTNSWLTIVSEDATLSFSSEAYAVIENSTNAQITVIRKGYPSNTLSVTYTTVPGGTAVAGLDYLPVTGTLTWASNDVTPRFFDVPLIDNTELGDSQSLFLAISNAVGINAHTEWPSNAVITLLDNETQPPQAGSEDPTFNANFGANAAVYTAAVDAQERIYTGGDFTLMHGLALNRFARLNPDGTVDSTFDLGTGFDRSVFAVAVGSNGPVLVGGDFTNYNQAPFGRLAMLQADGSPVPGFNFTNGANAAVRAIELEPLPTSSFSRFSFQGVQNSDTNVINAGINAGTVELSFTFQAYTNLATNVVGILNTLRIYYDAAIIYQTNVFVTTNAPVTGSAALNFGPGQGTAITITVNEGQTNGTQWQYDGTLTLGVPTNRRILIAGEFTQINGVLASRVARLFGDGSLDASFSVGTGPNRAVYAMARQINGQIVIAGDFGAVDDILLPRIARLNPDGSVDESFNPGLGADARIRAMAIQPDGRIVVAGDFRTFNGVPRNYIARLNPDATVDLSFEPGLGADGPIHSVAVQSDGKILAVGAFARLNGNLTSGIGRFNPDGSVDANFSVGSGANAPVHAVALAKLTSSFTLDRQASGTQLEDRFTVDTGATSGTIIVDYDFISVPDNLRIYYQGVRLFDLTTNGTGRVTVNYGPGTSTLVTIVVNEGTGQPGTAWFYSLTVQTGARVDNRFVVGGAFTKINEQPRGRIALLTSSGDLDPDFYPSGTFDDVVYALGAYTNRAHAAVVGKLVVGGDFNSLVGVSPVNNLARLNLDGTLDKTFRIGAGPDRAVRAVAVQPDGQAIIGGAFTTVDLTRRPYLARLNPEGRLDLNYNPGLGPNGMVSTMALRPDGKLIIGGAFSSVYGVSRNRIARMNANGTVDTTFVPGAGANGTVKAVALQPDGKILVGGDFTLFNGQSRPYLVRLLAEGAIDTTFAGLSGPNGSVEAIAVLTNGQIVVGGTFTAVDGQPAPRLARLNVNGSLDGTFKVGSGANDFVSTITVQPDGRLIVGGAFTRFNGLLRNRLTRLNPDGTIDPTMSFGTGANNFVNAAIQQPHDGKIVVGGGFTEFNGAVRIALARIFGGSSPGVSSLQFGGPAYTVAEDATNLVLTVVRVDGASGMASVQLSTRDGTATAGVDYVGTHLLLTFASGESFKSVAIRILDNAVRNGDRGFEVVLFNPMGGAVLGEPTLATVEILDDDAVVGFSTPVYSVTESGNLAARITVERQGGSQNLVTVDYATITNGSAVPFLHYTPVAATLVFNPFVSSRTFEVPILDELFIEGDLTISLTLSNVTGPASLGLSNATLIRIDDETGPGVLTLTTNSFFVNEGVPGGFLLVSVIRTNGSSGVVSARFSTANGSAHAGTKYEATSEILTFADGETNKTVAVRILDGTIIEGDQTFFVRLTAPTGGAGLGLSLGVVTIVDNDSNGILRFQAPVIRTNENAVVASIAVERVGGIVGTVGVTCQSGGGTALPGVRYQSVSNVLAFAAGETLKTVLIPLFDNATVQDVETIQLVLSNPTGGAVIGQPAVALVEIVDNEVGLTFSEPSFALLETGGQVAIHVRRHGNTNVAVQVDYRTSDGTAVAGQPPEYQDYVPTSGTLTFAPGQTNQTFVVQILDDSRPEIDEALNLTLSNGLITGGNANDLILLGPNITVPLTIVDDDVAFSFASAVYTTVEAFTNRSIEMIRSGGTNFPAAVSFQTSDGTATAANFKYIPTNGRLTFAPGQTSNSFDVQILNNLTVEGNQTVNLSLFDPSPNGIISGQGTAILLITDDEQSVGFSRTNYVVSEKGTNAVITLVRNGLPGGTVSVVFSTLNGTAIAGVDYLGVTRVVTWLDQDLTNKTVLVPILTNAIVEGVKTVNLQLSAPVGAMLDPAASGATLSIVDNAGTIAFSSASYRVDEGDLTSITLLRTGGTNGPVSVQYTATGGTASAGTDYTNATGVIAFGHGESVKTLRLPTLADGQVEGLETFNLELSNPEGGALIGSPGRATVTIIDADIGIIEFAGAALIAEQPPTNNFIDPNEDVTVNFAFRNRGAVSIAGLNATLLTTNGVVPSNGATQNYGLLPAGGNAVTRPFRFRATGNVGGSVTAVFVLWAGNITNAVIQVPFTLGPAGNMFENANAINLNDNAPATPYPSVITVSNVPGLVNKLTVTVRNLRHTYPADIDIALRKQPSGPSVILMSDAGIGEANNVTLTFDQSATNALPQRSPLLSGTYRPTNFEAQKDFFPAPGPGFENGTSLADFFGSDPNGDWSLYLVDDNSQDSGTIAGGWSLTINGGGTFAPVADLSLTTVSTPASVPLNGTLTYRLFVTNHGPAQAEGVVLTNRLPPGVSLIQLGVSHGSATLIQGAVVAQFGTLPINAYAIMTNVVVLTNAVTVPGAPTTITNAATVISAAADFNPANNVASAKTTVISLPELLLSVKEPGFIDINWSADVANFVLERSVSLAQPVTWEPVPGVPTLVNGRYVVRVTMAESVNTYYRLRMLP